MSILLYNKVDQNQITRRIDMSTTNIIAKITEIFDTNIEFEENFFKMLIRKVNSSKSLKVEFNMKNILW